MADNTNPVSPQGSTGGQQKPTLSWSQPAAATPAPSTAAPAAKTAPAPAATPVHSTNKPAADASNLGTYIGIFVAGIVIGSLIGWGITGSRNTVGTSTAGTTATSTNTVSGVNLEGSTVGASGSNVTLQGTQQAGFAVTVSKASVSKPTWVVVYEDRAGAPGNALGATLFFPGSPSGTISLLRATMSGKSYLVGQSVDNGDKTFSLVNDKPVSDEKGNALYTQFTAK